MRLKLSIDMSSYNTISCITRDGRRGVNSSINAMHHVFCSIIDFDN